MPQLLNCRSIVLTYSPFSQTYTDSLSLSVLLPFSVSILRFAVSEPVIHPQSESGWEGPGGQPYQSHRHFSNTHTYTLSLSFHFSFSFPALSLSLPLPHSLSPLPLSWFLSLSAVRGQTPKEKIRVGLPALIRNLRGGRSFVR